MYSAKLILASAIRRLLLGQRLSNGARVTSSRGLVVSEFNFGAIAIFAGLAGAVGDGSLNRMLAEGGHVESWAVFYCGGGAVAAGLAIMAYCEDDLNDRQVMWLCYMRMVVNGTLACCWLYIFRLMATEDMFRQAISICGIAFLATPSCICSLFSNALAARALDHDRYTPQLVPDRRRH